MRCGQAIDSLAQQTLHLASVIKEKLMRTRSLFAAMAVSLAAGCAPQPTSQPAPQASAAPAAAPPVAAAASTGSGGFEGVYRGSGQSLASGTSRYACPAAGEGATAVVRRGKVQFRWGNLPLDAVVLPDGSFNGANGNARISGRIAGTQMDFDAQGQVCRYHYSMTRS